MDQNSTNGAGTDKRNWRERLGIGAKEMPKISDEFRAEPQIQTVSSGGAKPASRSPQPVTRPAPMAPRAPVKLQAVPTQAPTPAPRVIDNVAQDALADKLRAQRAAAEKLAEQRVLAARERAEAKAIAPQPAAVEPSLNVPPRAVPQPPPQFTASRPVIAPPAAPAAARPKFSFAEEDAAVRKEPRADVPAPPRPALNASAPPRPILGGERSQPPFLRPSAGTASRTPTPPYRPTDPAGYAPQSRLTPSPRSYGAEAPGYGTARPPVRRPPAIDPYARQPDQRGYAPETYEDDPRSGPRLSRPPVPRGRPRPPEPEEDFEEVFEDEVAPARQRASARDYQNAYRETEGGYEEDQRRSSGPWLLLLGLLMVAAIAGGGVWYYKTKMMPVATTTPPAATGETVPLVEAPVDPAKTLAPEQPTEAQGLAPAAIKKKQIYDRIVGDQEVTGEVLPTEEIPVQPSTAAPAAEKPAVSEIPAPDAPAAAAPDAALPATDETAPLPLPPPPGNDTQGSLDKTGMEKIAAAAAQPEQGSTAPPPPAATVTETSADAPIPPPEPNTEGAALVSTAKPAAASANANDAADAVSAPAKPVKKKEAAKVTKKKPVTEAKSEDLGGEPVVLVPPSQTTPPSQGSEAAASAPVSQEGAAPEPVKKKKTLLDLFSKSSDNTEAPAQVAQPETQTASLPPKAAPAAPVAEPETAPAAAAKPASGTGYVVQLSSFSSQSEAQTEYGRLNSLYPTVVGGLAQRVAEAKVGGSTRYQLGLGPVKTRADATRVCSALFQAGERDCIVRSQ